MASRTQILGLLRGIDSRLVRIENQVEQNTSKQSGLNTRILIITAIFNVLRFVASLFQK